MRVEDLRAADRRRRVAALYLRGRNQTEIAAEVGTDQGTISRDLAAVHKEWVAAAAHDLGERKAVELAKIDALERTALDAWERSCKDAETLHSGVETGRTDKAGKPLPDRTRKWKTFKGQAGDPRFLERIAWCIDRRCELLGLDAPKKQEHSGPGGGPIPNEHTVHLSPTERIAQLAAAFAGAADRQGAGDPPGDRPGEPVGT